MSTAIIVPEPSPWLARVLREVDGEVRVFAPWALPPGLVRQVPGPRRLVAALGRRVLRGIDETVAMAGPGLGRAYPLLEAAVRGWAGGHADRLLAGRFALRRAVDMLAARWLPAGTRRVIAPACAARRTFAAARQRGIATTLVQDLPLLRGLHEDLDRAAAAHPGCAFLRRYRADHATVARQEAEWVLADRVLVRGRWAREALRERLGGPRPPALAQLCGAVPPGELRPLPAEGPLRVLLAGVAAARSGTMEALALLEGLPDATLLVRPAEDGFVEPADLLRRPGVRVATAAERTELAGIDLVVAPAWCESYPDEIARAVARGVPVAGTRRAAGPCTLAAEIDPGDTPALRAAVALLRAGITPSRSFPAAS